MQPKWPQNPFRLLADYNRVEYVDEEEEQQMK